VSDVFGAGYAAAYDALYEEKDYEAECDLVERVFATYGDGSFRSILDLGCGTGNHAIPLARRGYDVVGVDISEAMLERARAKAGAGGPEFELGDIRDVRLGRAFDAVLVLFAVLGYQRADDDVLAALRTAREHLRPGGLLLFDVWYGPAVLRERPGHRERTVEDGPRRLVRSSDGRLDTDRNICTVDFRLQRFVGDELVEATEETHEMRYFFPDELEQFLADAGLRLLRLGAFPDVDAEPDDTTWNVLGVATTAGS
jgi:SAM-dependent methyltransferase